MDGGAMLKDDESGDEGIHPFKFYLHPNATHKIIEAKWLLFSGICFVVYAYHFVWAISGVDKYADYTRFKLCGDAKNMNEATSIYDRGIMVVTVFHILEWVRQTVFLVTALIGTNMIAIYYALSFNIIYGFIALIVGLADGYGSDAQCQEI